MRIVKASEVKAGTELYITDTGNRWATAVALEDAKPHTGRWAEPGAWITFYEGFPGTRWPQMLLNGKAALPEAGDGPVPVTWHDRHMDGGII